MARELLCLIVVSILLSSCARPPAAQTAAGPASRPVDAAIYEAWTSPPDPSADPKPKWIWGPEEAKTGEERVFRMTFNPGLPRELKTENPSTAWLWAVADNEMTVYLNGKIVLRSYGWGTATVADVRSELISGENVIAVKCRNEEGPAGLALKLEIRRQYEEPFLLVTDSNWKTTGNVEQPFRGKKVDLAMYADARVLGDYGMEPWGVLETASAAEATSVENLTLLPGFKAELIYSVPKRLQGSWVAMTPDPKGRLYVSDQSGPLYRVTPPTAKSKIKVEQVEVEIGCSQGMLWAFDSLYVVVNSKGTMRESGLYRLRDTNRDDKLDSVELLKSFKDRNNEGPGWGEHGPHAIVLGPDKKSLYIVAGNFTNLPEPIASTSPAKNWDEDQLLPRMADGKGHDPNINAPASWVCRTDKDGKTWEVFAMGMRNAYDIAFSRDGELITYDSDMEWDIGSPWYRPTRLNHLVSGSDSGWRHGSGKFPPYYPDTLQAFHDMGVGSPTGVTFGTGAKFPAKYQRAFFGADWAYGKIYAVHMEPRGATYRATVEPFIVGKPFGVTDVVINPVDGAMYITIGGRGAQSGLYRVTYEGPQSTKPAAYVRDRAAGKARELRRQIERYHRVQDAKAIDFAWPHLSSEDRFIRYAARVAVENQKVELWEERALSETSPTASINALVALVRVGGRSLQPRVLDALGRLELAALSEEQLLEALRVYQLCFTRMGEVDNATASLVRARFVPLFPHQSKAVTQELCQLLIYLKSPGIAAAAMKLFDAAQTQEEQMFYIFHLRTVREGWSIEHRRKYFHWINYADANYKGGASYKPFLKNIREEASQTLSTNEMLALGPSTLPAAGVASGKHAPVVPPRQFVRNWEMTDLLPRLEQVKSARSFEKGREAFAAVSCLKCHRFNGDGDASGPDLTGAGARFQPVDLLEAMLLPSKIISDQYQDTEVITKKRQVHVGSVQKEDDEELVIKPSPLSPYTQTVRKSDIAVRRPAKMSAMPQGLLDVLSEDEILDLIAYIRSAGNPHDPAFAGAPPADGKSASAAPASP